MSDNSNDKVWLNDSGEYHRMGGLPAIVRMNGYLAWYIDGKKSNDCGPAVIYPDGRSEYWYNGVFKRSESVSLISADYLGLQSDVIGMSVLQLMGERGVDHVNLSFDELIGNSHCCLNVDDNHRLSFYKSDDNVSTDYYYNWCMMHTALIDYGKDNFKYVPDMVRDRAEIYIYVNALMSFCKTGSVVLNDDYVPGELSIGVSNINRLVRVFIKK